MSLHEKPVGATVEWYTPPTLFDRLGMRFALDPASPESGPVPWVPARRFLSRLDDGTTAPWRGSVWLNPPYGPALVPFVERMVEHDDGGMMLLAARTETRAFHLAAEGAHAMCFLRDRLHFVRADGRQSRSSFASVLFAYGSPAARALKRADLGLLVNAA